MKTIKTILVVAVAIAIASVVIRVAVHKRQAARQGASENAERNAATCVSLPIFPELTVEEVDYVISKVTEWDKVNA